MSKLAPRMTGPAATGSVPKMGKPSNVNGDRSLRLRAPRIRALNTRNYGKGAPNPYPDMDTQNYGQEVGFGPKDQ